MAIRAGRLGSVALFVLGVLVGGQFEWGRAQTCPAPMPASPDPLKFKNVFTHGNKYVITLEATTFMFTSSHHAFGCYTSGGRTFKWDHHPHLRPTVHQGGKRITLYLIANSRNSVDGKRGKSFDDTGSLTVSIFADDPTMVLIQSENIGISEATDFNPCP